MGRGLHCPNSAWQRMKLKGKGFKTLQPQGPKLPDAQPGVNQTTSVRYLLSHCGFAGISCLS